jgi:divalent metal cation (Fe/Co/Zn/Cd) transporter
VHLEPHISELGLYPAPTEISERIREVVLAREDVERIEKIVAFETDKHLLKIDVRCVFRQSAKGEMTIEQIHERVSEIEKQLRLEYPGSIVTIHAEPS